MSQPSQPPHPTHPTLLNLPQPPSNPDTPSEMPGTPTSTTTSLSALSTTAIKDGHRGALHSRGHQHSLSSNSLEAERADRISRLAGLSTVSTLRGPPIGFTQHNATSSQNAPVSTVLPASNPAATAGGLTPAYFDATGQPIAATKISTVGSASATESVGGRTTTETGGDHDTLAEEDRDEDMLTEMDSASASGYMETDTMDEDLDNLAERSVGGFEDRMSDDGSASLVGFGEGAGSTVSGPIYHRRPLPVQNTTTGPSSVWGLERRSSGLSEGAVVPLPTNAAAGTSTGRRDLTRPSEREATGTDTPVSQSAVRERREARMVDGVALDSAVLPTSRAVAVAPAASAPAAASDDFFVDTTTRGPVPVQPTTSAIRETQQPHSHQQATQAQYMASMASPSSPLEAAERIIRERLDEGESRVGSTAMASPKGGERLGRFYFEDR